MNNDAILEYPSGRNFYILKYNGIFLCCYGDFYLHGDHCKPNFVQLKDIVNKRNINTVSIRNPSMTNIYGEEIEICIEYFKSITILDNRIVVEV